jgi:cysteine protease ATG4
VEEEDIEIIKPLTTYSLDEVDVDDLSDTSSATSSPTNRVRKSTIRPTVRIDTTRTPPESPSKTPESPTTPLAPSPSKNGNENMINSSDPTPMAGPERTRSRSTDTVSQAPAPVPVPGSNTSESESTKWFASAYTEAQLRTFHCDKIKKIPLSNVDPSMLLGFMCKNEADFEDFCQRVNKVSPPPP